MRQLKTKQILYSKPIYYMSKIEIKDLYLIFGNEKQKALKMLKKDKSKEEILKDTGCTVGVKDANL